MSGDDRVYMVDAAGRPIGAMMREDFEDACALREAIQTLFADARERLDEAVFGIVTSLPAPEVNTVTLDDIYKAYARYKPTYSPLIIQPRHRESAQQLGLTEGREYVVNEFLPDDIDAVHIDHERISRAINDLGTSRYPYGR